MGSNSKRRREATGRGRRLAAGALAAAIGATAHGPAMAGMCDFEVFHSSRGQIEGEASRSFAPNDQFVVCFRPTEDGYVALWDRMPLTGPFERLVPNVNFRGEGVRAAKVAKDERRCFGDGSDGYYLFMDPGDGTGRGFMWLMFTQTEGEQSTEGSYATSGDLTEKYPRFGAGAMAVDDHDQNTRGGDCQPVERLRYPYEVRVAQ